MQYGICELKDRVNGYFEGSVTKEDLGKWAERAYYDLLKGEYLEQEKIVLYPFVKTIASFHWEAEERDDVYPCSEGDVRRIQAVLNADEPFEFQVEVTVPAQVYANYHREPGCKERYAAVQQLGQELTRFIEGAQAGQELYALAEKVLETPCADATVLDMLQGQIARFCRALFDLDKLELKPQWKLYPDKTDGSAALLKLRDYLECYVGNKSFIADVSYSNGKPALSIVV